MSQLWSPTTSDAEKLGWADVYAEDGSLLGEYGEGSATTAGSAQYIWLPTASGAMPIAAIVNGRRYAVHSDHLNTPRRLTQSNGRVAWQWAYSAFGDEQPIREGCFKAFRINHWLGATVFAGSYLVRQLLIH